MRLPWQVEDRALSAELSWGVGSIALAAAGLAVALLLALWRVGATLEEVRSDAASVREALELSLAIREHYLHESQTVIERNAGQVERHAEWLRHLRARTGALQRRMPPSEREQLEELLRHAAALDRAFQHEVLPAALEGRRDALLEAHRRAGASMRRATEAADAVVASLNARMGRARARAQRATWVALGLAVVGVLAILLLAVALSLRLRRALTRPLRRLAHAAGELGRGTLEGPIGDVGRGEVRIVARAFDAMVEELRAREQALVRSERLAAIGQLAAGVAHEINNPIAVMRGYLKTMLPGVEDGELADELRILDQEAAACQRIVEDLLSCGRDPELAVETVEIGAWLEGAVERFGATEAGRAVALSCDAEPARVELDPVRIRQVLDNLLTNAAQFSPAGGPVEVRGRRLRGGGYAFEVRDRGAGIDPSQRERVFEPFRSARSGGTGLGLATSRVIVRAHQGELRALPRGGGGTTLRVELPAAAGGPGAGAA